MTCRDCPTQLGPRNKSGVCRSCWTRQRNAAPEFQAAHLAGLRKCAADPKRRAVLSANARRLNATYSGRPANRAKQVAHGKRIYAEVLTRPDVRKTNLAAIRPDLTRKQSVRFPPGADIGREASLRVGKWPTADCLLFAHHPITQTSFTPAHLQATLLCVVRRSRPLGGWAQR